jgi:serine/threonine-protein kinase
MMITDNVRLVHEIAEGGMGSIWAADHLGLETQVAVKFVSPDSAPMYPLLATRFEREARMSAAVRSVHVVQSFDHGITPAGMPYLVMELLEGETLEDRLDRGGPLSLREVAHIVAQVAKVLQHAHDASIVHRDIKPANVFLMDQDYEVFVKVLDFGIAKRVGTGSGEREATQTGIAVGTPGFISPAQAINAKRVDYRADLWSLAALAYNALTGRLPYGHVEGEPWWMRLNDTQFPAPSSLRGDLPATLDAWFARALHPKPRERFGSASEMARSFVQCLTTPPRASSAPPRSIALDKTINMADGVDSPVSSAVPGQFDLFDMGASEPATAVMKTRSSDLPAAPITTSSHPPAALISSLPPAPAKCPSRVLTFAVLGAVCLMLGAMAAALLNLNTSSSVERAHNPHAGGVALSE